MSSTFDINDEIDRLVDKFANDLKSKLKKSVTRNEKIVVKKYTTMHKSTKGLVAASAKRPPTRRKASRRIDSENYN